MSTHSRVDLEQVERELNHRPRAILDGRSPGTPGTGTTDVPAGTREIATTVMDSTAVRQPVDRGA